MLDTHISLAHGNGGRFMRELIDEIFARHLGNPVLDVHADAARLTFPSARELYLTTDGFTVQPLEFPGGNIGSLAVHGTVNDLAVAGATPLYLSLNCFIEEGIEISLLERIVASLAHAAGESGVVVATGDTKVVRRGEGGGIYLATTGIGRRATDVDLGMESRSCSGKRRRMRATGTESSWFTARPGFRRDSRKATGGGPLRKRPPCVRASATSALRPPRPPWAGRIHALGPPHRPSV